MELPGTSIERKAIHAASLLKASTESGISAKLLAQVIDAARDVSRTSVTSVGAAGLQAFVAAAQSEREMSR